VVAQSGLPLGELMAINQQIRTLRSAMQAPVA
jgi:hypothetical protein